MRKCSEAVPLAALACDRALRPGERLRLALHRLFCAPCRIYRRQLEIMRRTAAGLAEAGPVTMDDDMRRRIEARLRAARAHAPDRGSQS